MLVSEWGWGSTTKQKIVNNLGIGVTETINYAIAIRLLEPEMSTRIIS